MSFDASESPSNASPAVYGQTEIRTQLPLRPSFFHFLLSLSQGVAHGYALKRATEERTAGALLVGPGTLYESLQRMEKRGLIIEAAVPIDAVGERADRRYYGITDFGVAVLRAELQTMEVALLEARQARLLGNPSPA